MPEQEQEMNISSREFIKKAEFINIATLMGANSESDTPVDTGEGTGDDTGGSGNGGGTSTTGGSEDNPGDVGGLG